MSLPLIWFPTAETASAALLLLGHSLPPHLDLQLASSQPPALQLTPPTSQLVPSTSQLTLPTSQLTLPTSQLTLPASQLALPTSALPASQGLMQLSHPQQLLPWPSPAQPSPVLPFRRLSWHACPSVEPPSSMFGSMRLKLELRQARIAKSAPQHRILRVCQAPC